MGPLERGVVEYFTSCSREPHGRMKLTSGERINFHWQGFQLLTFVCATESSFAPGIYDHPSRRVHRGEMLYFRRKPGEQKNDRADVWCMEENYLFALEDLEQRFPGHAIEHLALSGWLESLVQRASYMEIGFTGHVSDPDRRVAHDLKLKPLTEFERKILGSIIKAEKAYRQDCFRDAMIQVLGEDPDAEDF